MEVNEKDINFKAPLIGKPLTFHIIKMDDKTTSKQETDDFTYLVEQLKVQEQENELNFYFDCLYLIKHNKQFDLPIFFSNKIIFSPNFDSEFVKIFNDKGELILHLKEYYP